MQKFPAEKGNQGQLALPPFLKNLREMISSHWKIIKERQDQNNWMVSYSVLFMIGILIFGSTGVIQQSNISLLIQALGICLVGFSLAFLAIDIRSPVFDLDASVTAHYHRIVSATVMHLSQAFLFVLNLPPRLFELFANNTVLLRFSIPLSVLKPIPSLPLSFRS